MYVIFEGIDTSGKSTQIELLKKDFPSIVVTKEPGGTKIGKKIREMILYEGLVSKRAEAFLFLADRAEHFRRVVKPNLYKTVVSDRGFISGIAYQMANDESEDMEFLIKQNLFALENTLPDKVVFFKTNENLLKERLGGKKEDLIEKRGIDYLLKVQEYMEKVIKKLNLDYIIIDAGTSIEEINKTIKGYVFDD